VNDTPSPSSDLLQVDAPHRELLDQVLDKWSLQVLDELCGRPMRFNELRRAIPTIGQKSLTATLRRLERNGMIERVVLQTRPVAVEYRIAPVGNTLNELIDALLRWTTENLPAVERARERFDTEATLSG
jgi:DNA-binding HxlR family transcriptional regulator